MLERSKDAKLFEKVIEVAESVENVESGKVLVTEKIPKIWNFFENLKFSLKYDKISEKFTNFQKSEKFPKIWTISENMKKNCENLKNFRKSENFIS